VLVSIAFVAFGARLAWALWTAPVPAPFSDAEYYNSVALSLAHGEGYAVRFADSGFLPGGPSTVFWPPGYPAFLAAFHWLLGDSLAVARMANVLAGTLTVVPVYFIGRRLFSAPAGLLGAAIVAVLPSLVFWTPVLMSETFFTFVFACALALLLYCNRVDGSLRPRMVIIFGLATAVAALVRGQALVLLPMAFVWWAMSGASWRQAGLASASAVLVAAAMLIPWSIRNIAVTDSPILMSANLGYNLRIGHAPYSSGHYILPSDLWDAEPGLPFADREVLFNDLGTRRALVYARDRPGREIGLAGSKIIWLWRPSSDVLHWVSSFGKTPLPDGAWEPLRLSVDISYFAMLLLALCALLGSRMQKGVAFALLLLVVWTVTHIVFFGEPRYHLPLLVVIAPMAGAALEKGAHLLSRGLEMPLVDKEPVAT